MNFDAVRISKAKEEVDIDPLTIKKYHKDGLPLYQRKGDRAVYFFKSELAAFIRMNPVKITQESEVV